MNSSDVCNYFVRLFVISISHFFINFLSFASDLLVAGITASQPTEEVRNPKTKTLVRLQEKVTAIEKIASGETLKSVAAQYGVLTKTVNNWRKQLQKRVEILEQLERGVSAEFMAAQHSNKIKVVNKWKAEAEYIRTRAIRGKNNFTDITARQPLCSEYIDCLLAQYCTTLLTWT